MSVIEIMNEIMNVNYFLSSRVIPLLQFFCRDNKMQCTHYDNDSENKNKLFQLISLIKSVSRKLLINKNYFITEMLNNYLLLIENIENFIQPVKEEYDECNSLSEEDIALIEEFINDLTEMDAQITEVIAPDKVYRDDPCFGLKIDRVCYRGDSRPPKTEGNKGIFNIGFRKNNLEEKYKNRAGDHIEIDGEDNIIKSPFESNQANIVSVGKFMDTAALFPLLYDTKLIKIEDMLTLVNKIIKESDEIKDKITVSIAAMKLILIEEGNDHLISYLLGENFNNIIRIYLQKYLSHYLDKDLLSRLLIFAEDKLLSELPKSDTSWLYVVYVKDGFDVTSHGFLAVNKKQSFAHSYNLLFANEICTAAIPPEHIFAAYQIERNFENMKRTGPLGNEYAGEAKFKLLTIEFNPIAIDYLKAKGIDIQKYQSLLESCLYNEKNKQGYSINLSSSGYHPVSIENTYKKNEFRK